MMFRVGFSKDIHKLVDNRKLLIGGVIVPFHKGEEAHSDGDVLFHAVAESILGALGKNDLGYYFPDTINETKDMDSSLIVKRVLKMMKEENFVISNIDILIQLEKPKLKECIALIKKNVTDVLEISLGQVSIKVGTNEGFGEVGRNEAIECYSCVLLEKK